MAEPARSVKYIITQSCPLRAARPLLMDPDARFLTVTCADGHPSPQRTHDVYCAWSSAALNLIERVFPRTGHRPSYGQYPLLEVDRGLEHVVAVVRELLEGDDVRFSI